MEQIFITFSNFEYLSIIYNTYIYNPFYFIFILLLSFYLNSKVNYEFEEKLNIYSNTGILTFSYFKRIVRILSFGILILMFSFIFSNTPEDLGRGTSWDASNKNIIDNAIKTNNGYKLEIIKKNVLASDDIPNVY